MQAAGLSVGWHAALRRYCLRCYGIRQGLLYNVRPDGHADPAVSPEVAVHGRLDLLTGKGLNLPVFVVEGQGLVKTADDGQFIAHLQIAGRVLGQGTQQVLLDVVELYFAGPFFQVLGKQGLDPGQSTLAVA